eukprot:TRINITY_DN1507_c1_g2_i2.p1 TRINITY_DN1507_c1_g2~~TRINITY_DN1507_c1_g2_i2.p1  ORF type:complete len:338 (+),score=39.25 TRINITY_DN1507_c1_g2_i2:81-1016(+)
MPLQKSNSNSENFLHWIQNEVDCPIIDANEIILNTVLGKGQFGEVWLAKLRGNTNVAVKKFFQNQNISNNNSNIRKKPQGAKEFLNEVKILTIIKNAGGHKNLVNFFGICISEEYCGIVMEYVPNGTLKQAFQTSTFSYHDMLSMCRDIAEGLQFLHNLSIGTILQRDLKPENLLLDHNNHIVIADFGLSSLLNRGTTNMRDSENGKSLRGSPIWMAPEILLFKKFDSKCDIYSFAIVLWEMLTLEEPFSQFTRLKPFRVAVCYRDTRPIISENIPQPIRNLLTQCWHKEPSIRPNASELVTMIDEIIAQL